MQTKYKNPIYDNGTLREQTPEEIKEFSKEYPPAPLDNTALRLTNIENLLHKVLAILGK